MFSGIRPTDDIFVDGLNLHNYIEMNLPKNVKKIIGPLLLYSEGKKDVEKCIASLFRIGLGCSESSPNDRMDMNEAIRELHSIKGCGSVLSLHAGGGSVNCKGGIMASEAVSLLRTFYEQGNPNAPKPHRSPAVQQK